MERFFGSWQGRLPQELGRAGIITVPEANRYIREKFLPWHRRHWIEPVREKATAFVPCANVDLDAIFCVQHERSVAADNTVTVGAVRFQIAPQTSRWSYAKCRVKVCEHLDGRWSVRYGPHLLGWYLSDGQAVKGKLKRTETGSLTENFFPSPLGGKERQTTTTNNQKRTDYLLQEAANFTCY